MAHPASAHVPLGPEPESGDSVPAHVRTACDELFQDADRHGPRARELWLRLLAAAALLPTCIAASTWLARSSSDVADVAAVGPTLIGLAAAGLLLAPLARVPAWPLFAGSVLCIVPAMVLVAGGSLVIAAPISAAGVLLLGLAAARLLYRAVWVLPMLFVAGVSDAQSVQGGVTEALLDGSAGSTTPGGHVATSIAASSVQSIDYLVLHVPTASGMWILGLVDVLALGLLLGLTHLYWQSAVRTALALLAALVLTVGFGAPVPVLPALGLAWVLANASLVWRSTRFTLRRLTYLGG